MANWGYARVSSVGQSLESQIEALKKEGVPVANIESEHITGTKLDRPKFNKLIKKLKEGDTLYVTKLDRFARNTEHGLRVINELVKRGVRIHVLNLGLLENTPVGRLMINVIMSIAEFERDLIWERTQTGKAIAKAKDPNWREGRKPKYDIEHMRHALALIDDGGGVTEVSRLTGISRDAIYRKLNERKAKDLYGSEYERLTSPTGELEEVVLEEVVIVDDIF